MSEMSSSFLRLTPAMHQMDGIPGPMDQVSLNMAVESLTCHFVSGDTLGDVANNLKTNPDDDNASLRQSNGMSSEEDKTNPPPVSDMNADSVSPSSVEEDKAKSQSVGHVPTDNLSSPLVADHLENPILPAGQNSAQDAVATTTTTEFLSPATTLKRRLECTKDLIVCPGVYDGFSARIALSVGFDALYMVSITSSPHLVPVCSHYHRQVQAPRPHASASPT